MRRDHPFKPSRAGAELEAARFRGRADGYSRALLDVTRLHDEALKDKPQWIAGLIAARSLLQHLLPSEANRAREAEAAREEWQE